MKTVSNIDGDIRDCCVGCLEKNQNMYNLSENVEKGLRFTTVFNIKLVDYERCPQFLCGICDIKLSITHNFLKDVKKCLVLLEEHNKQIKNDQILQDTNVDEYVEIRHENEETFDGENRIDTSNTKVVQKVGNSKTDLISPDVVNRVIEEFKNMLAEKKTCILCGFIAANRRAISSHMAIYHKKKKNVWCLECNNIFENYDEHKKTHSGKYKCPFCEKEINLSHYIEHLQSHMGIFECYNCNKTFSSAAWLKKHKRIHTDEKPYSCPNCSRCFIQLSSLRYHVGTHGKFSCETCKKHYKTEKELEEHECTVPGYILDAKEIWINAQDEEGNEQNIEKICVVENEVIDSTDLQNFCKDCNKRVKSLRQHIDKHHTVTKPDESPTVKSFQCEFCQKTYSNHSKLKEHMRIHTGELPYKCKYCDKRTVNRTRHKDHERTHTKEKPYICNVCGKGLSQASALRTHMRRHTGRPEVCHLCNKTFCRKAELRLHLNKHMGEKPFLCTECGRTFAQRSHLTEHMAGHSEARPFQCPHCQKAFKKNILLKSHMKLHQGNKPFKCPVCFYACYKAYRLQQHMKQHNVDHGSTEQTDKNIEFGSEIDKT